MILYGKPIADKIYKSLESKLRDLKEQNIISTMAVILIGEDPVSLVSIKLKEEIAERLGIEFKLFHLLGISSENQVINLVSDLNKNKFIHGIVVQLPLPDGLDQEKILQSISPQKDIDGLNSEILPPTAAAILEILEFYNINYKHLKIVIVGRGRLVGGPLEKMLTAQGVEPLVCDSKTNNLKIETLRADILILATGTPDLIKADMVRDDTIVIDAGTTESNGKMTGDVSEEVYGKVETYSPVPGGVGPVTVACLMRNLIEAAR